MSSRPQQVLRDRLRDVPVPPGDLEAVRERARRRSLRQRLATVAAAVVVVAAGVVGVVNVWEPDGSPVVDQAPSGPASEPAHAGQPRFQLLGATLQGPASRSDHTTSPQQYRQLWQDYGLPGQPPEIDFGQYVVVFVARIEDNCLDTLEGVTVDGNQVAFDWLPPPGGCEQPALAAAAAVALHRGEVPAEFTVVEPPVREQVSLPSYDGPPPSTARSYPVPPEPATVVAEAPIPAVGTAQISRLPDGQPVWVVHPADGHVRVLATQVAADDPLEEVGGVTGLSRHVVWWPGARQFEARHHYDAYGVSLTGRAGPHLHWYASQIEGSSVHIGELAGGVPYTFSDPEAGPTEMGDPVFPDDRAGAMSIEQARTRPDGSVVVLDADVVAYGDRPVQLCKAPEGSALFDGWTGCPADAPAPDSLSALPSDYVSIAFGPLRVRVVDGEFTDVTLLGGGYAGSLIQ